MINKRVKTPQQEGNEDECEHALTNISFVLSKFRKSHESQVLEQWPRSMQVMYSSSSQSMNVLIIGKRIA
jgi:hypothetical protein